MHMARASALNRAVTGDMPLSVMFAVHPGLTSAVAHFSHGSLQPRLTSAMAHFRHGSLQPWLSLAMPHCRYTCLERTAYGTCTCSEQSCGRRQAAVTKDSFRQEVAKTQPNSADAVVRGKRIKTGDEQDAWGNSTKARGHPQAKTKLEEGREPCFAFQKLQPWLRSAMPHCEVYMPGTDCIWQRALNRAAVTTGSFRQEGAKTQPNSADAVVRGKCISTGDEKAAR